MSFPNKAERRQCHSSRDEYWQCLDKHKVTDEQVPEECKKLRKAFESSCPGQWVKHFDRKRLYEVFQAKIKEGFDPLDQQK